MGCHPVAEEEEVEEKEEEEEDKVEEEEVGEEDEEEEEEEEVEDEEVEEDEKEEGGRGGGAEKEDIDTDTFVNCNWVVTRWQKKKKKEKEKEEKEEEEEETTSNVYLPYLILSGCTNSFVEIKCAKSGITSSFLRHSRYCTVRLNTMSGGLSCTGVSRDQRVVQVG